MPHLSTRPGVSPDRPARFPGTLAGWTELGLGLRVLAACAVGWLAMKRGTRCLFPDTDIYWRLGQALRTGEPYEVSQWGVPHFALRTPGYPLFLALVTGLFGDRAMPVRLAQAGLGAGSLVILAMLVERVIPAREGSQRLGTPALAAAALAAVDPYTIGFSVVLLSEALFLPLMLLGLWGLAAVWPGQESARRWGLVAIGAGVAWGAAVLVKPSWAIFPPAAMLAMLAAAGRGRRRRSLLIASLIGVGLAAAMSPWWVRNARVYDRFVPTALWMGASLYDGLSPGATGSSDMRFLDGPDFQPLDEEAQDAELTARALGFVRAQPGRVLRLALAKAVKFWSPWPGSEQVSSPAARLACATWVLPIYGLVIAGLWTSRRDVRALVLLAGPLLYFAAIHMVFVSSIRYRVPGLLPALGLAGLALRPWLEPTRARANARPGP